MCIRDSRLTDWLPSELKHTKMHTEALLAVEVDMGLNGFCRIQVDIFHKPARLVRADR